jgi:uncharacterized membrane protein YraQ (UPF0718 family)
MINKFVAKEGLAYIYISFVISIIAYLFICDTLALLALFITLFFIFIYRNNLKIKAKVENLVSPISGRITAIDKVNSQSVVYLDVGLLNSHILIAPKDSNFKESMHRFGLNLCSNSYKAKELNEKRVLNFDDIKIELISGKYNITHPFLEEKDVKQYDKIGVFLNGVIKIYIPNSYDLKLKLGQKIKAGEVL